VTAVAERSTMPSPDAHVLDVEIVVPVFNEEADLEVSVRHLDGYLRAHVPFTSIITIADNASTDGTWQVATALADTIPRVRAVHLEAKGRGRALQQVWSASTARVVAYMDVDLSTDLNALLPLIAPLLSGHSDVAIGSRLARTSRVVRGSQRELISRGYNLLLRSALRTRFSDAQCGFKALTAESARALLPHVHDTAWFFDTELLVLAERSELRIAEVPVDWIDDPDSRVDIVATAVADLRGVARLGRSLVRGELPLRDVAGQLGRRSHTGESLLRQAIRFGMVGVASTLAYLGLFLLWRGSLGAQAANLLALLVTAVLNTGVNRRFTFGVSGTGLVRHQLQGLFVFAVGLGLTSGSLAVLGLISADPPRTVEVAVLVAANLAATVLRFVLLREWVFATRKVTR
jgi:putative flippase GtrA